MLPMLSTIYLREMAAKPVKALLYGQYEFHSIQRVKRRYGHQSYVVKWKKGAHTVSSDNNTRTVEESDEQREEITEVDESVDQLEENNVLKSYIDDGCWFLLNNESIDLVYVGFPDAVDRFLHEKELKDLKRRKCSSLNGKSESVKSKGVQLNITEFYRSTKVQFEVTEDLAKKFDNLDDLILKEKGKVSSSNIPKSVRRRLLSK